MPALPDGLILDPSGFVKWDPGRAVSVRFVVPTYRCIDTGKEVKMPTMLINDMVSNIPLEFDNLAGALVPPPMGGTAVPMSSDPTVCTVAMGADGKSVDVTPTAATQAFTGTGTAPASVLSFTDTTPGSHLSAPALDVQFTSDVNAASVHWVTTGITTRPLP